jgi:hypothetical protein
MAMTHEDGWIEQRWATLPEPKLELIGGRLIISTLRGSRRVLWELLHASGPAIALPLAPPELWWAALRQGFSPTPAPRAAEEWEAWAGSVAYDPEPGPAGPHGSVAHREVRQRLQLGLYGVAEESGFGQVLGRDFVVRLGENGLTPDLLVIDRPGLARLHDYYLEGPPALVIEVTSENSGEQDRVLKRRLYEAAGVPEYWLIDAEARAADFLRLGADGRYQPASPDSQAVYRSAYLPDLALVLPDLWLEARLGDPPYRPFLPPSRTAERPTRERTPDPQALTWGSLPFEPRVALDPVPIRFEEYIAWCPEAKFEWDAAGLIIGSPEGSRHVLGLLLMTFGLVEAVRRAHPREWLTFLNRDRYEPAIEPVARALLRHASFTSHRIGAEDTYISATIPELPDVRAGGATIAECQQNLTETLRSRLLLRLARHEEMPPAD